MAQDDPQRPLAVAAYPDAVMQVLQSAALQTPAGELLRACLISGLIVLDQQVESVLNQRILRDDERPLYRSDRQLPRPKGRSLPACRAAPACAACVAADR